MSIAFSLPWVLNTSKSKIKRGCRCWRCRWEEIIIASAVDATELNELVLPKFNLPWCSIHPSLVLLNGLLLLYRSFSSVWDDGGSLVLRERGIIIDERFVIWNSFRSSASSLTVSLDIEGNNDEILKFSRQSRGPHGWPSAEKFENVLTISWEEE